MSIKVSLSLDIGESHPPNKKCKQYLLLTMMNVRSRMQKRDPNPMTKATLMACSHSMFKAVAKDERMEQSLE